MINPNKNDSSSTSNEFSKVLIQIATYVNKHDIKVKPFKGNLDRFNSLTNNEKTSAIAYANIFLNTLEKSSSSDWSRKDDLHFLWNSLKALKLTPSSDIFDTIKNNDVVEIFNLQNVQIWRNLASMDFCSYTLEEMYCYSLEERYLRNEEANLKIQTCFQEMFALNPPATYHCDIKNIITEIFGEERLVLDLNHKTACLLFDSKNTPQGYIVVSNGKVLEKRAPAEQQPANVISINSRRH